MRIRLTAVPTVIPAVLLTGLLPVLLTVLLAGCGADGSQGGPVPQPSVAGTPPAGTRVSPPPSATTVPTPRVQGDVATGLDVPWGLDFLPGGDALIAERDTGRVIRVTRFGAVREAGRVPGVLAAGESGLLGLAVSPGFASDQLIFVYYTTGEDNRIARLTYQSGRLGRPEPIVTGIPSGPIHDGGRLEFGPDGMLYASTGESGDAELAQDLESLGGKILRLTPSGNPAPDNPFGDSLVYSYGHRNVEGLAFDSAGRLWASEFGESTSDELNLIRPGGNYGWPRVEGRSGGDEYTDPVAQWTPGEASPSGVAVAGDVVYMAALRGERLWQMPIRGAGVGRPAGLFTGEYGRLRTVEVAPDGALWLTTSNLDGRGSPRAGDDRILRVALR
ncbi:MAG: PQQ-dependent sugar dehydrogenase [Carbonactinosporaceae bacterium]